MPQMSPISWFMLFIIFSITFILFNIMNYYIFIYQPTTKKISFSKTIKSLNWKW